MGMPCMLRTWRLQSPYFESQRASSSLLFLLFSARNMPLCTTLAIARPAGRPAQIAPLNARPSQLTASQARQSLTLTSNTCTWHLEAVNQATQSVRLPKEHLGSFTHEITSALRAVKDLGDAR